MQPLHCVTSDSDLKKGNTDVFLNGKVGMPDTYKHKALVLSQTLKERAFTILIINRSANEQTHRALRALLNNNTRHKESSNG